VQVGQFMLSRPIVMGPLLGLLWHSPQNGLALGACCELLSLDDLPVGDRLPLNATVAAGAALLLTCGPRPLPVAAALPVGFFAAWAHKKIEGFWRSRRRELCAAAERSIREGEAPSWGCWIGKSLAQQAAGTFALMLACVWGAGPIVGALWLRLPHSVVAGLELAWRLGPWLGLGVAFHALRVRP